MAERKPGRPPLDVSGVPSAAVHLKLPAAMYDNAERLAKQQRRSIQDVIRRGLTRLLHEERSGSF